MNEEQKIQYKEKYTQEKQKGVRFWPDIIYKDVVISLALFIVLVIMATWVGVAQEAKADPSDSTYIPRPEWYFLFLFKFLAIYGQIPLLGKIEWIAVTNSGTTVTGGFRYNDTRTGQFEQQTITGEDL